jgi:outer membrane protein OmpA-like peptidoglycan-associated protein
MLQFQGGSWHKFYFAAGAKAGIPLYNTFKSDDTITYVKSEEAKLKTAILASLETGMKWKFKEHVYLYTGVYLDYGMNSILRKTEEFTHYEKSMTPVAVGFKLKLALGAGSVVDPPHLVFSAGPDSIPMGQSSVLNWITLNTDEVNIEGIGPVPDKGSVKVKPSETAKYTITARGRGGVKMDSVIVAVESAPAPSVVFTVSPKTIQAGHVATLNWMVSDADEVSIKDIGPVTDKGSKEIKPSVTTKYILAAKGKGGERTDSVEIVVEAPHGPAIIFNAVPESIQRGQTATLSWITTDAEEVSIEGIGSIADKGTRTVKPSHTTKYILTAKGKGISKAQMVEVIVEEPPPIEEKVNLKGVNFLPGKAVLSLDAKRVLDGVAEQLLAYPNVKIEIQGHSDNVGKAATNQKLSENRAKAVVSYLATKGVKMNRMKAIGYGPSQPIADNATEEGRELNRRIEMIRIDQ